MVERRAIEILVEKVQKERELELAELKKARNDSESILSNKLSEINSLNYRITELEEDTCTKEEIISKRELEIENLNQEIIELKKSCFRSSEIITTRESEIKKINDELLKQLDDLIKTNEEMDKFVETVSNELQEPLIAIKSFNNILAKRCRKNR